jgi:hypothetical protein
VLARIVGTACGQAVRAHREILARYAADRPAIATTVVGAALARVLLPSTVDGVRVLAGPAEHLVTSTWIAVAGRLPLAGPVLVADYDPYACAIYVGLLNPAWSS